MEVQRAGQYRKLFLHQSPLICFALQFMFMLHFKNCGHLPNVAFSTIFSVVKILVNWYYSETNYKFHMQNLGTFPIISNDCHFLIYRENFLKLFLSHKQNRLEKLCPLEQ